MATSFPYLAIARDHDVSYGDVIRFVAFLDKLGGRPQGWASRDPWEVATILAWCAEQERRKANAQA